MNEKATRAAFEKWYSDACEWPRAVEKDGSGEYRYAGASAAWEAWKAASERAESMAQALRVIHTWASSGCLVGRLRAHAEAHEYIANADHEQRQWMNDLYDAADALERVPRWRDVSEELPQEAQEVLFVRGGKVVHGAWIGGIFWHSNQKMAA